VLPISIIAITNWMIRRNLRENFFLLRTSSFFKNETGATFKILIANKKPTTRLRNINKHDGINHVLTWNAVASAKSRFRKSLKTGKKRNNNKKDRIRLINPVRTASIVNSAITSAFVAPFTILIPIPLILLAETEEYRFR
jgi:hypothetical protein